MKILRLLAAVLLTGVLLAACSNSEENADSGQNQEAAETQETEKSQGDSQQSEEGNKEKEQSDAAVMDSEKVVAVVNGEEILGKDYNITYQQTSQIMQQQGQKNLTEDQLKKQTLDTLIDQELLRQDAEEKGIKADEKKVNENFEQVKSQFESEKKFKEELKKNNLTEELLKNQVEYTIIIDNYIKSELEKPEVKEQEVKDLYEKLAGQTEEAPAYEDVKEQLRDQLVKQQQNKQISSVIDKLRKDSEIEEKV